MLTDLSQIAKEITEYRSICQKTWPKPPRIIMLATLIPRGELMRRDMRLPLFKNIGLLSGFIFPTEYCLR